MSNGIINRRFPASFYTSSSLKPADVNVECYIKGAFKLNHLLTELQLIKQIEFSDSF